MPRVGSIRCQPTEDLCPGATDFTRAKAGKAAVAEPGPSEIALLDSTHWGDTRRVGG